MNIVRKIKAVYKLYKDRRFLKRHGCTTWKQYYWKNDPRVYLYADRVKDYYKGYKYISLFTSSRPMYEEYGDWLQGLTAIKDWCDNNCSGHWRCDIHRVIQHTGVFMNGSEIEWVMNDIGGHDILFFAFDDDRDYMLFMLRWQ